MASFVKISEIDFQFQYLTIVGDLETDFMKK